METQGTYLHITKGDSTTRHHYQLRLQKGKQPCYLLHLKIPLFLLYLADQVKVDTVEHNTAAATHSP